MVGIGWKHRNTRLSEIVDVLVVMCLHQNGRCPQMFASNFKQEAVQLELMTCLKFPLAKCYYPHEGGLKSGDAECLEEVR